MKHAIRLMIVAVLVSIVPASAGAAEAAEKAEHADAAGAEKLAFFVGTWTGQGVITSGPAGSGGSYTMKETCDWFDGKLSLVCRSEASGPEGPHKALTIVGFSTEDGRYTFYSVDTSHVSTTVARGTFDAGTWTYTDESPIGGKAVKNRAVMKQISPTSYSFRWEMLGEDGTWVLLAEGTARRSS